MSQLVVNRQYLSPKIKMLVGAGLSVLVLTSGFYLGVLYSVYRAQNPLPDKTVQIPAELPSSNLAMTSAHEVPGANADVFHHSPDGNVVVASNAFEWQYDDLAKEIDCMAKNIYFEARNEDIQGQISVGLVTITRVKSDDYPNTVCDVVWQKRKHPKTGKYVAQFSWTWDGKHDDPKNQTSWENSVRLAEAMLAGGSLDNFHDFLEGADHYHATYVDPYWNKHLDQVTQVGTHIFYRQPRVTVAKQL